MFFFHLILCILKDQAFVDSNLQIYHYVTSFEE